jgi:WD40 repeat protein
LAIGDERGRVRIVDTDHPDRTQELFAVGNSVVLDVTRLGNERVAAADNNDMTWIWTTGEAVPWARLATHDRAVFSVGADRAGRTLVTAGADGHLQVFDTDPGRVLPAYQPQSVCSKTSCGRG